jgi:hypothetical protein
MNFFKIITYVKDERYNLNNMITTLKLVVSCEIFGLKEFFLKHLFCPSMF